MGQLGSGEDAAEGIVSDSHNTGRATWLVRRRGSSAQWSLHAAVLAGSPPRSPSRPIHPRRPQRWLTGGHDVPSGGRYPANFDELLHGQTERKVVRDLHDPAKPGGLCTATLNTSSRPTEPADRVGGSHLGSLHHQCGRSAAFGSKS